MRVFIGCDEREEAAVEVCAASLRRVSGIEAEYLRLPDLLARGLMRRPTEVRGGQSWDLISQSPVSTEFAFSRFLVPHLAGAGLALFVDCDAVFLRDPREMLVELEGLDFAVAVVRHPSFYCPGKKMDGKKNVDYPMKNWSSVMLFDCDHPANKRLTVNVVNQQTGLWLHRLQWASPVDIEGLSPGWNWLVDLQPRPQNLGIAHMTLGGPWLRGWSGGSFDAEWLAQKGTMLHG